MNGLTIGIIFSHEQTEQLQRCVASLELEIPLLLPIVGNVQWRLVRTPEAHFKNISFFNGQVIDSTTSHLGQNRNLAFHSSQTEGFYFTDPDCRLNFGALMILCEEFENERSNSKIFAFAGPNILCFQNKKLENTVHWLAQTRFLNGGLAQIARAAQDRTDWHSPTCHILYNHPRVSNLKFSDQFSKVGEDLDFHFKASRQGFHIKICSESFVWHDQSGHFWNFFKKTFRYGTAQTLLLKAQPSSIRNRRLIILLVGLVWIGLFFALSFDSRYFLIAYTVMAALGIIAYEIQKFHGDKKYVLYSSFYGALIGSYFLGQLAGLVIPLSKQESARPTVARNKIS